MGTNWSDSEWLDFSSSEEEHVVADDEDLVKSSDDLMAKGSMESIDSGVSFKSDRSRNPLINFKDRVSPRAHLKKLLFSGISCVSAERDDSQGCTADVKETPPSPKEKPEDLIGADIDSVRDDEDWVKSLYSLMAKGSMESIDSGVSLKSDRSRNNLIDFKDSSSPSRPDFSSSEEEHVVADDEDWVKSSYSLEEMNQELSSEVGWEHR